MSEAIATQRAQPTLAGLVERLDTYEDFAQLVSDAAPGGLATLDGVWGSACALIAAALTRRSSLSNEAGGPLVVVFAQADRVDEFGDELELFSAAHCVAFPAWESDPGERLAHDEVFGDRVRLLKSLSAAQSLDASNISTNAAAPTPDVIATSIHSLLQPVPGRDQLASMTRRLAVGDVVDVKELLGWLTKNQLHRTSAVELPGEFAARGGIMDIFAADWFHPVRIELFGDEIESIRQFDVASQRSSADLPEIDITILQADAESRQQLADYLPADSRFLLVEPSELKDAAEHYLERCEAPQEHFSYAQVIDRVQRFTAIRAEAMTATPGDHVCRVPIQSVERFSGDIGKVRDELDTMAGDDQVYVVCLTDAEVPRIREILGASRLAKAGRLHFPVGRLKNGFRLADDHTLVISGSELFRREEVRRTARRRLGRAIDSFLDLREGDLVVHLAHGIGRYRGIELLERENQVEEHLTLEFHGGTRIYVPASRIGMVQKYVGGTKGRARLARIGGQTWVRQKRAAETAVADLAVDMLDLQAARRARPGIRFGNDSAWQQEFDASFPYHETPDQLAAIESIRDDMTQPRPMDRLLCGDVGFGKTELAMRAAFKAIDNGFQVAVLVPTTVLAEQHLRTFQSRMAEFPFEIASLSRFSTRKQQQQTIERLAAGQIDIVIGTHRLAQADVRFHNLGLIIIDEEQRFGVEVKERLKQFRQTVDVLTMTATPIPRTLHLSLLGARDISNLETPPEDRLAVETRVTRFGPDLIRHAVLRELNRNGQVFFVHNRIQDIERVAARLREIVPEATIEIGHGQMPEGKLEQVMVDFVAHRFDILLSTTIVESGLDIPNANTIFIDDADRYGLADLHQLRGRVGRYKHRAYCYLLVDQRKSITPTAAKRLRAIEEFSTIGAGFAIAMRDLEIRGAGNLLGTQQSGHIAAVGYEFYCQLLENAVLRLRRQPPRQVIDVDIDLPGEAHFPRDYMPDMRSKLDIYRRLARISTDEELRDIEQEIVDRFGGPLPAAARRVLALGGLRIDAAVWGIHAIRAEETYVVLQYGDGVRIKQLSRASNGRLRVVDDCSAYLPVGKDITDPDRVLEQIKSLLQAS